MKKNVVVVVFGTLLVLLFVSACCQPPRQIIIQQENPNLLPYPHIKDGMSCQQLAKSFDECILIIDDYNKKVGR